MANSKKPAFNPGISIATSPLTKLANKTELKLRPSSKPGMETISAAEPMVGRKNKKKSTRTKTQEKGPYMNPELRIGIDFNSDFSSSEDFNKDNSQGNKIGLFPSKRADKINFDYVESNPLSVMQLEDNLTSQNFPTSSATLKNSIKLTWNLASYARNFEFTAYGSIWNTHLKIIFERYSREIVSKIRSKIIDTWTESNFKSYLSTVVSLMEFYYCVDSILAYEGSDTDPDRNSVLLEMKTQYSDFDILVKHDEARRILKNCWLPDKFSALIMWTYQNYKYGEGSQCGNYRMFPNNALFAYRDDPFDAADLLIKYNQLILSVTTITNRNIISLLSQTYPKGIIGNLPSSCSQSVYDAKHHEMYINQGIIWPNDDLSGMIGFPNNTDYDLYSSKFGAETAGCFPFVLNATYDASAGDFVNGALIPIQQITNQAGVLLPSADWEYQTNKFYAYNNTPGSDLFRVYPRNWDIYSTIMPCNDTHTMNVKLTELLPAAGRGGCISMSKGEFQNLYFNTNQARLIVMREFLNAMFYLK
jgi:hypothetical protein